MTTTESIVPKKISTIYQTLSTTVILTITPSIKSVSVTITNKKTETHTLYATYCPSMDLHQQKIVNHNLEARILNESERARNNQFTESPKIKADQNFEQTMHTKQKSYAGGYPFYDNVWPKDFNEDRKQWYPEFASDLFASFSNQRLSELESSLNDKPFPLNTYSKLPHEK